MKRASKHSTTTTSGRKRLRGCSQIDIEGFTCWVSESSDSHSGTRENNPNLRYSNKTKEHVQKRNELIDLTTLNDDKSFLSSIELTKFQSFLKSSFGLLPKKPLKFGDKSIPVSAILSQTPTKGLKLVAAQEVEIHLEDPAERNTKELIATFKRKSLSGALTPGQTTKRKSLSFKDARNSLVTTGFDPNLKYPKDVDTSDWWKYFPTSLNNVGRMQQLFGWCIQLLLDNDSLDASQITLCNAILVKLATKDINTSWYLKKGQEQFSGENSSTLVKELNQLRRQQDEKFTRLSTVLSDFTLKKDSLANAMGINADLLNEFSPNSSVSIECLIEKDERIVAENESMISRISNITSSASQLATKWNNKIKQLNYDFHIAGEFCKSLDTFYPMAVHHTKSLLLAQSQSQDTRTRGIGLDMFTLFRLYCDSFQTDRLVNEIFHGKLVN